MSGSEEPMRAQATTTEGLKRAVIAYSLTMDYLNENGERRNSGPNPGPVTFSQGLSSVIAAIMHHGIQDVRRSMEDHDSSQWLDPAHSEQHYTTDYASAGYRLPEGFRAPLALLVGEVKPPQKYPTPHSHPGGGYL